MQSPARKRIQVMDTTLRDGEQTPEVAYTPAEKLQLAQMLLEEVGVDRIEIAGTRVSEGEREAARQICAWARKRDLLPRIEMLGYVRRRRSRSTGSSNTGGKALNLLTKGSERHCLGQLRMSPEQHRKRIADVLAYARHRSVTRERLPRGLVAGGQGFARLRVRDDAGARRVLGRPRLPRRYARDPIARATPRAMST